MEKKDEMSERWGGRKEKRVENGGEKENTEIGKEKGEVSE